MYISGFQKLEEETRNLFSEFRNSLSCPLTTQAGMDKSWIEEGLQQPGKSKIGLAKALSRAPSMVTALLKPERDLKLREIRVIERYLGVTAPYDLAQQDQGASISVVYITGEVAGGVWAEPGFNFERIATTVAREARWAEGDVFILRVRGSSINRKAKDGDWVLCLDAYAAPRKVQNGDWVIAERERNGFVETTVKKVGLDQDGAFVLIPESTDPQFQQPVLLGEHHGETVSVRAFVLQFIQCATDF